MVFGKRPGHIFFIAGKYGKIKNRNSLFSLIFLSDMVIFLDLLENKGNIVDFKNIPM